MAMERSGAMDIAPRGSSDLSPEAESPTACCRCMYDPSAKKKKGFQPFKSIKKLFGGKKKGKKDEVTGVGLKSKSCDDSLDRDGSNSQLANKTLSLDSVFSERPRDGNQDFSRSMEVIPQHNFKDELANRLRRRMDDSEDDGLPSSPPSHVTTADALIENGLQSMSMDSLLSMESLENEVEEEFFQKGWTSGMSTSPHSTALGEGPVDLDAVRSTSSLNYSAAKHKIAVKRVTKHKTTHPGQRRKAQSPKPSGGVVAMPQLREESPPKVQDGLESDDVDTSHDQMEMTDEETGEVGSRPLSPEVMTSEVTEPVEELPEDPDPLEPVLSQEDSVPEQSSDSMQVQKDLEPSSQHTEVIKEVSVVIKETTLVTKEVVLRTKSAPDKQKKAEQESVSSVDKTEKVVMRDSSSRQSNPIKRQTIAGDEPEAKPEVTVFGPRKVKRSSLVGEARDWENLGKAKDKTPEEEPEKKSGSEFASVFAKFQRNASQRKTDLDTEASRLPEKKGSRFVGQKSVGVTPSGSSRNATEPAARPTAIPLNVQSAKNPSSTGKLSPTAAKPASSPSASSAKTITFHKLGSADKVKRSSVEEEVDNAKRSSTDSSVTRSSLDQLKRDSVEKPNRDSTGSTKRQSVDSESEEKTRRNSQADTVKDSNEKSKRHSVEKEKRNSVEGKRELKSSLSTGEDKHASPRNSKDIEIQDKKVTVVPKSGSKFVSVQQKTVPLNDKKSEPSSSSQESHSSTQATARSVGKIQTKTEPAPDKASLSEKKDATKAKELIIISPSETSKGKPSSSGSTAQTSNKRESPRPTNRLRSQTVPEAAISKTPQSAGDVTAVKRTISEDGGVNKENIPSVQKAGDTSSQKSSLVRPAAAARSEPQKQSSTPAWLEKARKRTDTQLPSSEDTSKPQSSQSQEEKAAKRASVMDLMKKFQ